MNGPVAWMYEFMTRGGPEPHLTLVPPPWPVAVHSITPLVAERDDPLQTALTAHALLVERAPVSYGEMLAAQDTHRTHRDAEHDSWRAICALVGTTD